MISAIQKYACLSSKTKTSVGVGIGGVLTYGLGATSPLALAAIFGFGQIISRLPDGIYGCLSKKKIEPMKTQTNFPGPLSLQNNNDDAKEPATLSLHAAVSKQGDVENNCITSVPIMDAIVSSKGPQGLAKPDHKGNTALHAAIINNDYRSAWHLIKRMRPVDLAKKNNSGNTALHEVIKLIPDYETNYTNVFLQLLTKMNTRDLSIKNKDQKSALDLLEDLLRNPHSPNYCWRLLQKPDLMRALQGVRPIIVSK